MNIFLSATKRVRRALSLAVVALVLWAQPASAAFSASPLATVAANSADTQSVTATVSTSGGDYIACAVSVYSTNILQLSHISDSVGGGAAAGTWAILTPQNVSGFGGTAIYYVKNPSNVGSDAITWNGGSPGFYPSIACGVWSGSDLSAPFDQQSGATGSSVTSLQTGSITPTSNGQLLLTAGATDGTAMDAATVGSGFALAARATYSSGLAEGAQLWYLVQSTAAPISPTWSFGSTSSAVVIASFKSNGGGSPRPCMPQLGTLGVSSCGNELR